MPELPLLINIGAALVAAFVGGWLARRVGWPTLVGYLLAGIVIGPFTPGFVGDTETISQLAELGVIFLMFGVGLDFSFAQLWRVRDIAVPGAVAQMVLATLLGVGLTQLWGWSLPASLILGIAVSMASTVVLLRGLMDNKLLNTSHGQAAVGWLVMQDLAAVLVLVLLPALAGAADGLHWDVIGLALGKAALFLGLMLFGGSRLVPWLLNRIAHTRSRELFILAMVVLSLGIALGSAGIFGVSLALGAFVAGAVVSESPLSPQVGADVLPFREVFSSLFFVSVGMLVNPSYLLTNAVQVLLLLLLVVVGKYVITVLLGVFLSRPARTALVVAAGSSQIGEFSFIVGSAGLGVGLLNQDQYALILAGSLFSIAVNPWMFRTILPVEHLLHRLPRLWKLLDRHGPIAESHVEELHDHLVVVGYGRVGHHIVDVARTLSIPHLVIEADVERGEELQRLGTETLYGDAANSEVLTHAGLDRARALVVTLPDPVSAQMVVAAGHHLAPHLPIIARAATTAGLRRLSELGASDVIQPELEGGLEIVRHTLLRIGFPLRQVSQYADAVRRDHYDTSINLPEEHRLLHELVDAMEGIELTWLRIDKGCPLVSQTLVQADIRARTGASIVVIIRDGHVIPNPKSLTLLMAGDRLGIIGDSEQVAAAAALVTSEARGAEV